MMKHSSTLDGPALFRVSSWRSKNPGQIWGGMYQRMLKQLNFQTTRMRWVEITLWSLWSLYSGTLDAKDMKLQSNKGIDSDCQVTYGTVDFASYKSQPEKSYFVPCHKWGQLSFAFAKGGKHWKKAVQSEGHTFAEHAADVLAVTCKFANLWAVELLHFLWFAAFVRSIEQTWHMSHMSHRTPQNSLIWIWIYGPAAYNNIK